MTVPLTCNRFWGLLFCARANKETVFSVRQIQTFLLFLCLSQSAAACLLGQLGQHGVAFDLQPVEWIAAATHALSAPAEVRPPREEMLPLTQTLRLSVQGRR